jgi:hypothetical protein
MAADLAMPRAFEVAHRRASEIVRQLPKTGALAGAEPRGAEAGNRLAAVIVEQPRDDVAALFLKRARPV